jgi:hypothetical protein
VEKVLVVSDAVSELCTHLGCNVHGERRPAFDVLVFALVYLIATSSTFSGLGRRERRVRTITRLSSARGWDAGIIPCRHREGKGVARSIESEPRLRNRPVASEIGPKT